MKQAALAEQLSVRPAPLAGSRPNVVPERSGVTTVIVHRVLTLGAHRTADESAIEGGADAAIDDLIVAVAQRVECPLMFVTTVPGACRQLAPLAVSPELSATIPSVLLSIR